MLLFEQFPNFEASGSFPTMKISIVQRGSPVFEARVARLVLEPFKNAGGFAPTSFLEGFQGSLTQQRPSPTPVHAAHRLRRLWGSGSFPTMKVLIVKSGSPVFQARAATGSLQ